MKIRIEDSPANFCRLAFTQFLFEAGTVGGEGEPAFSVTAIIPPNHPAIKEIEAAEEQVAKAKWGEKAPAILKTLRAANKTTIKDGELKAQYDGFEGNKFISMRAKPKDRPNVYGRTGSQLTQSDGVIYAGCYAHVIFVVWAQDSQSYGKRLNAQVTGVMFSRDGDSFGGGSPPANADDFADLSAEGESLVD